MERAIVDATVRKNANEVRSAIEHDALEVYQFFVDSAAGTFKRHNTTGKLLPLHIRVNPEKGLTQPFQIEGDFPEPLSPKAIKAVHTTIQVLNSVTSDLALHQRGGLNSHLIFRELSQMHFIEPAINHHTDPLSEGWTVNSRIELEDVFSKQPIGTYAIGRSENSDAFELQWNTTHPDFHITCYALYFRKEDPFHPTEHELCERILIKEKNGWMVYNDRIDLIEKETLSCSDQLKYKTLHALLEAFHLNIPFSG